MGSFQEIHVRIADWILERRKAEAEAGDIVKHPVFGKGEVIGLARDGLRISVHFDNWGTKSLAVEFARLERL